MIWCWVLVIVTWLPSVLSSAATWAGRGLGGIEPREGSSGSVRKQWQAGDCWPSVIPNFSFLSFGDVCSECTWRLFPPVSTSCCTQACWSWAPEGGAVRLNMERVSVPALPQQLPFSLLSPSSVQPYCMPIPQSRSVYVH